jgi:hypothetical protein
VYASPEYDGFQVIVESETFDFVREGEAIQLLDVTVRKKRTNIARQIIRGEK